MTTFNLNRVASRVVTRIKVTFEREDGNPVLISGTAFWMIDTFSRPALVTNRHNVDPEMKLKGRGFRLARLEVMMRGVDRAPHFCEVDDAANSVVRLDGRFDCAVIVEPSVHQPRLPVQTIGFKSEHVADHAHFNRLSIADSSLFIGYPGSNGSAWWDQSSELPIARGATLGSIPSEDFKNAQLSADDVGLVSGLSFSGSSGSPVFNVQKGISPGGDLEDPSHVPMKLIGIMSGHWQDDSELPSMLRHTGLSYYTRSTAIVATLVEAVSRRTIGSRMQWG